MHIEEIRARLDNESALARFIAAVPFPPSICALLRKPIFCRGWPREQQCDYWLASDGADVVCVIAGGSAVLMSEVRARFDDLRLNQSGPQLSRNAVH